MNSWVIYKIESPTGRIYIGKTVNFGRRMKIYKKKCHEKQRLLCRSLEKYGFDAHVVSIIESGITSNYVASLREKFWINQLQSNLSRFRQGSGLNLTDGGDGTIGSKHIRTKEMNERQRELKCGFSGISIIQYDLEGNIMKEFSAKRIAAKELGISRTTLRNILQNKTNYTFLPFILKNKGDIFNKEDIRVAPRGTTINRTSNSETLIKRYGKQIYRVTRIGERLRVYHSITVAAKKTMITRQYIRNNLLGKTKAVNGYRFSY